MRKEKNTGHRHPRSGRGDGVETGRLNTAELGRDPPSNWTDTDAIHKEEKKTKGNQIPNGKKKFACKYSGQLQGFIESKSAPFPKRKRKHGITHF